MDEIEKILMSQSALVMAVVRLLITKGILTKEEILSDLHLQSYDAPVPREVLLEIQALLARLSAA